MNSSLVIINGMKLYRSSNHIGLYTASDFAFMLGAKKSKKIQNLLSRLCKQGVISRVCRDLYYDPLDPPVCSYLLERIAVRIHRKHRVYVSLESELSRLGVISQVSMQWLTVMTTGRSGVFKTPFGTIEMIHTERNLSDISDQFYFDTDAGILRAKPERAFADLKRVGRNLHMTGVEGDGDAA